MRARAAAAFRAVPKPALAPGAPPAAAVEADEPYILRDYRGLVFQSNVFQYLPESETLRVYTRMVIEVSAMGPGKINVLERQRPLTRQDPQFANLYESRSRLD